MATISEFIKVVVVYPEGYTVLLRNDLKKTPCICSHSVVMFRLYCGCTANVLRLYLGQFVPKCWLTSTELNYLILSSSAT